MSARPRLGLVALGQTPRPDLEVEFRNFCDADLIMVGALDGIDTVRILAMNNTRSGYPLHTRLADGSIVDIPLEDMAPLVAEQVNRLQGSSDLVVVMCAGRFPEIRSHVPVILPGTVTLAIAKALSTSGRVGVIVPNAGQVEDARDEYGRNGLEASITHASPFVPSEMDRAGRELRDASLDFIVIECMGHGRELQERITAASGRNSLLAQTLTARVTAEVLQGMALAHRPERWISD